MIWIAGIVGEIFWNLKSFIYYNTVVKMQIEGYDHKDINLGSVKICKANILIKV
jgi:hypothetical protein